MPLSDICSSEQDPAVKVRQGFRGPSGDLDETGRETVLLISEHTAFSFHIFLPPECPVMFLEHSESSVVGSLGYGEARGLSTVCLFS